MKEIKAKGITAARKELVDFEHDLQKKRFKASGGDLKDVRGIRKLRRTIARLKTFINNQSAS